MDLNDITEYFDDLNYRDLGELLHVSPSQFTHYKTNGVPEGRQAIIHILTNGALSADLSGFDLEKINVYNLKNQQSTREACD